MPPGRTWNAPRVIGAAATAVLAGACSAALTIPAAGSGTVPEDRARALPETAAGPGAERAERRAAPYLVPDGSAAPRAAGRSRPAMPAPEGCAGPGWRDRRAAAALAALRRPGHADGYQIATRPGREGVRGMALLDQGRIELFVSSCDDPGDALLRHVLAHELGHLVDAATMTPQDRQDWLAARGIPAGTPWYGCDRCDDFSTPAGDFAEVYAQWQRGGGKNLSRLAARPGTGELARLADRFFPK